MQGALIINHTAVNQRHMINLANVALITYSQQDKTLTIYFSDGSQTEFYNDAALAIWIEVEKRIKDRFPIVVNL